MEHNLLQQVYSATLNSATENDATIDSEKLRQYNVNSEIRNSVTLTRAI